MPLETVFLRTESVQRGKKIMAALSQQIIEKYHLKQVTFSLHIINAIVHIILTNLPGHAYAVTKVLLLPLLCSFFLVSVNDLKRGWCIPWALCGLWLGNICLIWGDSSKTLFFFGSAFTIIGIFGYLWVLVRPVKSVPVVFVLLQLPIIWSCASFVLFMKNDLNHMLVPIALYMTLIAVVSMLGLAHLMTAIRSSGAWFMFTGTLFYIAENGLYTADHYMAHYSFGVHIVHPCFIAAQTLIVCGYLLMENERLASPASMEAPLSTEG